MPSETHVISHKPNLMPRERAVITFVEPSKALQDAKVETDVNRIVRKYNETGWPEAQPLQYGDFSNVDDYQTAQYQLAEARQAFETLPARIREAFSNDPARLLGALKDPDQHQALRDLGVLTPSEAGLAQRAQTSPPTPEEPTAPAPPEPLGGE